MARIQLTPLTEDDPSETADARIHELAEESVRYGAGVGSNVERGPGRELTFTAVAWVTETLGVGLYLDLTDSDGEQAFVQLDIEPGSDAPAEGR